MDFDYVIAGGGSAGCTLAARLSEDASKTVCLIEAGGEGRNLLIRVPAGIIALLPGRPKINNWGLQTVPQQGLGGRKGYQPRGKALGGSSAINAMLYTRGHRGDYDEWAGLGCQGWSWNEVLPYFKRAEGNQRGADALHGGDGPLRVANSRSRARSRAPLSRLVAKTRSAAMTISTGRNRKGRGFIRSRNSGVGTEMANAARQPPPICIRQ